MLFTSTYYILARNVSSIVCSSILHLAAVPAVTSDRRIPPFLYLECFLLMPLKRGLKLVVKTENPDFRGIQLYSSYLGSEQRN